MRKIPVTMATQHPDNIHPAYFNNKSYINTTDEVEESYLCWSELGIHEYMWDWEGKFVDEAVVDKLFRRYFEYFQKNKLGEDIFLTYRIPNIWQESGYRLMRAFMNIVSIAEFSKEFGYDKPPVFEIILPMTESSDQLIYLKEKFHKLNEVIPDLMEQGFNNTNVDIEVIPLFEECSTMIQSGKILGDYVDYVKKLTGKTPKYLRSFLARSDPAMNIGIIPAVLGVKAAISQFREYEKKTGIKVYSWLGGGSLPFRGNVSPDRIDDTINEYKGLDSITVQSSFRYDHDLDLVKESINKLNQELPKNRDKYKKFSDSDIEKVVEVNKLGLKIYSKTLEKIAGVVNNVADSFPKRRERMLHVGLFGYSRGVGDIKLPRAIGFTGSLYSIGVPPELISSGRLIKALKEKNLLKFVEANYLNLKKDLAYAYKFLNKENLLILAKDNKGFKEILEDVKIIEEYLGKDARNDSLDSVLHRNETSSVLNLMLAGKNFVEPLENSAKIRKSLG